MSKNVFDQFDPVYKNVFDEFDAPTGTVTSAAIKPGGVMVNPISTKPLQVPKASDWTESVAPIPKLEIKPDDSKTVAAGKEIVNLAAGIPNFFTSPLGPLAGAAGVVAPTATAAYFTADALHSLGSQAVSNIKNWSKMTDQQKWLAWVDMGGATTMAALTGHGVAKGAQEATKGFIDANVPRGTGVNATPPPPVSGKVLNLPAGAKPTGLYPALKVGDQIVTGGDSHDEVAKNAPNPEAAQEALKDDANHVFQDDAGNVHDRAQAGARFDEAQGNPPGTTKNLHSTDLIKAQKKAEDEQRRRLETEPSDEPLSKMVGKVGIWNKQVGTIRIDEDGRPVLEIPQLKGSRVVELPHNAETKASDAGFKPLKRQPKDQFAPASPNQSEPPPQIQPPAAPQGLHPDDLPGAMQELGDTITALREQIRKSGFQPDPTSLKLIDAVSKTASRKDAALSQQYGALESVPTVKRLLNGIIGRLEAEGRHDEAQPFYDHLSKIEEFENKYLEAVTAPGKTRGKAKTADIVQPISQPEVEAAKNSPAVEPPATAIASPPEKSAEFAAASEIKKPAKGLPETATESDLVSDMTSDGRRVLSEAKSKPDEFSAVDATDLSESDRRNLARLGISFSVDRKNRIMATWSQKSRQEALRKKVAEKSASATAALPEPPPVQSAPPVKESLTTESKPAKEPWEMTKAEYIDSKSKTSPETRAIAKDYHWNIVNEALQKGKPVPPEVLADYPDLKSPAPKPPISEASKPTATPTAESVPQKGEGVESLPKRKPLNMAGQVRPERVKKATLPVPSYEALPARTRQLFEEAWASRDPQKMGVLLDPQNRGLRAEWERRTGEPLPKQIGKAHEKVRNYFLFNPKSEPATPTTPQAEVKEPFRYHDPANLEKQGYKPTGVTFKSKGDSWEQQRIAQQLNTPQESLTAFRMEDGSWKSYLKPGKKLGEGYVSEPMLPNPPAPSIPAKETGKSENATPRERELISAIDKWKKPFGHSGIYPTAADIGATPKEWSNLTKRGWMDKGWPGVLSMKARFERDKTTPPAPQESPQPEIKGMGGAVPSEFQQGQGTPTAMKYRKIDEERQKRGLPPLTKPDSVSDQALMDKAMAEIDRNPATAPNLVNELNKKARVIEPWERMALLLHKIDLRENYERSARDAAQAFEDSKEFPDRKADMLRHNLETTRISDELTELEKASRVSGSETGRALRALQIMANEDYSLAGLEMRLREKKMGYPVTDEERAQLKSIAERYQRENEKLQKLIENSKSTEYQLNKRIDELLNAPKPKPVEPHVQLVAEKLKAHFKKGADDALARIKARRAEGRLFTGIDPTELADYAVYGANKIFEKGISGAEMAADWADDMKAEIGEHITPHLKAIWEASKGVLDKGFESIAGVGEKQEKVRVAVKDLDPAARQARLTDSIRKKFKAGKGDTAGDLVQRLGRTFVEQGVKDRDELITKVHDVLKTIEPKITRREAMDAMSGYGDFKPLSKDEVSVAYRDLKRQMQEVAKLEDMAFGKPPLKTGKERSEWSKEQARLQKLVNEAKFEFQVPSDDPARQLQSALDTYKKRTQRRIDEYQRRIDEKDFSKKPRRELKLDPAALDAKVRVEAVKREFDGLAEKARKAALPKFERGADLVSSIRRFGALSGISVLGKLAAYTLTKIPTMVAGDIAGSVLRHVPGINQIAEKAPTEGTGGLRILARSVAKGFTLGMQDAYDVATKGRSEIKEAYSKRPDIGKQWYDIPVIIHEIIKSPLRRIAFENAFARRVEYAAKQGVDVNDLTTQIQIAQDAFMDSDRELLLEQNRLAQGIRGIFKWLETPNKKTGKASRTGKTLATLGRIDLPVLSVPLNFAKQTLMATFGLISGSLKGYSALRHGIDNLSPEEADAIMRHLKVGSIGGAVALFGFFDGWNNYNQEDKAVFGGYYQPYEKRKPGQAGVGGIKIRDHKISGLYLHNPVLAAGQFGHALGSLLHKKFEKEGAINAMMVVPFTTLAQLSKESPIGRSAELIESLASSREDDYAVGEYVKGIAIPQLLNEIAQQSDQPNLTLAKFLAGTATARKAKTPLQHIETAIPGLRETLPRK